MNQMDKEMEDYRAKREMERQNFLNNCLGKITDGEFAYELLVLAVCKRFKLDVRYPPSVAYIMVEHFVENVDEPFNEWVNKNDAPFIRPFYDVKKIFPEFTGIAKSEREIIKLANKIYNLDLDYDIDADYVYSFSFDFNSFTPLNLNEVQKLKLEIEFCKKYGVDCSELEEQLMSYGLDETQLELLSGGE